MFDGIMAMRFLCSSKELKNFFKKEFVDNVNQIHTYYNHNNATFQTHKNIDHLSFI